jgi:RNA-binding protein 8A
MSSPSNHHHRAAAAAAYMGTGTPSSMRRKYADDRDAMYDDDHHEMPPPPPVAGPLQSIEGWVLFVTGVHEEAQEDDLSDIFSEYGRVKSIHLNLDRKTGVVKGYALIEYDKQVEAQDAVNSLHGTKFLGKPIGVHWAFCKSPTMAVSSSSTVDSSSGRRRRRREPRF